MENFDKLGRYEILDVLGRGGMGVVYKARDPVVRRLVALKTLNKDLLGNAELRKRFTREAEAAGALQHVNIVTIFDMGEADGIPYIAMQLLDGESLEKTIARRVAMPLADKLKIVIQFCRGLHFAHTNGVVHRDVKPANFVVTADGQVKVVDFGIVHLATSTMTQTGQGMGTPHYMSPEQLNGEHVDARSDIFSVGVVMYEFFAYRKPFEGPHIGAIITSILTKEVAVPLRQLAPEVPPELEELVNKCLRKAPADRFHSLEELLLELEPIEQTLKHQRATEMASQAQELLSRGDLYQAQKVCQRALAIDSTHGTIRALLSQVRADIQRQEASVRVRQLLNEAGQLLQLGKAEEAIRDLEDLLKLDSQNVEARAALDKAREQKVRDDEVRKALSAGKQAYQEGDLTLAESQLKKVLVLDAENPEATTLLRKVQQEHAARERRYPIRETMWEARRLLSQDDYEAALEKLEGVPKEFAGEGEVHELLRTARDGIEKSSKIEPPAIGERPGGGLGATRVLEGLEKRFPDAAQAEQAVMPPPSLEPAIEPLPAAGPKPTVETPPEKVRRQTVVAVWKRPVVVGPMAGALVLAAAMIYFLTRARKPGLSRSEQQVESLASPATKEEAPKAQAQAPVEIAEAPKASAELTVAEKRKWQSFQDRLQAALQAGDKTALQRLQKEARTMIAGGGPLGETAQPAETQIQQGIAQIDKQAVAQNLAPAQVPPTGKPEVQPGAQPGGRTPLADQQTVPATQGTAPAPNGAQQTATLPSIQQQSKVETPGPAATPPPVKPPEPAPSKTESPTQVAQPQPAVVFLAPTTHTPLSGAFDSNRPYPPEFLDEGFRLLSHPVPPEVAAPTGTVTTVKLEVSSEGQVTKLVMCVQGGDLCQAVANAAKNSNWKFSSPTYKGKPAKATATVRVQF